MVGNGVERHHICERYSQYMRKNRRGGGYTGKLKIWLAMMQELMDGSNCSVVMLKPFSEVETREFLSQYFEDAPLPELHLNRLAGAVWDKTAGLPLFIEQMAAHLHSQVNNKP